MVEIKVRFEKPTSFREINKAITALEEIGYSFNLDGLREFKGKLDPTKAPFDHEPVVPSKKTPSKKTHKLGQKKKSLDKKAYMKEYHKRKKKERLTGMKERYHKKKKEETGTQISDEEAQKRLGLEEPQGPEKESPEDKDSPETKRIKKLADENLERLDKLQNKVREHREETLTKNASAVLKSMKKGIQEKFEICEDSELPFGNMIEAFKELTEKGLIERIQKGKYALINKSTNEAPEEDNGKYVKERP